MPFAIESVLSFAWRYWKAILVAATVISVLVYIGILKGDASHYKKLWTAEKATHALDIANYRAAADEAARLDKANVDRVTKEQTAITEKVTNDYQDKLADSASRYDRLRAQASGYLSRPASPGVPEARDTTCRAVSGADCEAIPAILKAAQDNTDQLIALQAWVTAQSGVDTNGDGGSVTP